MSLPLLRPLLLTVSATSLVFFGGVIALAVQSPEPIDSLPALTLSVPNLVTQNADITSDLSSFKAVANPLSQSSLAALTPAQATALAKQNAPSAVLQATPELINYNGSVAYEVLLDSGTIYIDANIDAVLNPVATDNYRVDGFDDDYDDDYKDKDDDDKYKSEKHGKKKHNDDDYKENERLITTSYQQYDEDDYDD
ncbi:PepSY domain-containing protein [Psychrobacter sp. 72-O-c]|uniref:PepSY domain-containing protein n=1 Tax=Psychrobacter sp. 72-O-c TaxID=2774125 RepID=UPI00191872BC|nr:PepSY domain-containing protein [Psychrobacter sp. 72-O-c]